MMRISGDKIRLFKGGVLFPLDFESAAGATYMFYLYLKRRRCSHHLPWLGTETFGTCSLARNQNFSDGGGRGDVVCSWHQTLRNVNPLEKLSSCDFRWDFGFAGLALPGVTLLSCRLRCNSSRLWDFPASSYGMPCTYDLKGYLVHQISQRALCVYVMYVFIGVCVAKIY